MARNKIESVLTALPLLMLIGGLYYHYSRESEQQNSAPIVAEKKTIEGEFAGFSEVKGTGGGQHFIWTEQTDRSRGTRMSLEQLDRLNRLAQPLVLGDEVIVEAAPTVSGSRTLWLLSIQRDGEALLPQ